MVVLEGPAIEVVIGFVVEAIGTAMAAAESIGCVDAVVVVAGLDEEVVGGCAAASDATLPVSVVEALGTAVHRLPPIEVMEKPAGRDGFVDMTSKSGDAVARKERTVARSTDSIGRS